MHEMLTKVRPDRLQCQGLSLDSQKLTVMQKTIIIIFMYLKSVFKN